ncbi:condensation domain-containing protein [Streptacidiphilus sp. P02-A3a]|uniref:condensation domain-containing protein n=1 Tax=Streptacidiphilus sp. P02-A3a TaxID=2704468 RepID=UPI0015F962EA|nr:condensation domain-containing protein [Streptacidiphilus sp. P02-A3a]QMU71499.1 condensation protein [Streptacidiphilus sp. P02-A3a]
MTSTSQITRSYRAGRPRTGPLTMGQANMIRCILRDEPEEINNHLVWTVPSGATLERVAAAFGALAERHESLRTRYPHTPGSAPTVQRVQPDGSIELAVVETADGEDPGALAARLALARRAPRFDLATEFPLRITVVTRAGLPVRIALVTCHAAVDATALHLLGQEFQALLRGEELPPPPSHAPIDIAAFERTPAGIRRSESSLRHWRRIVSEKPQAAFAEDRTAPTDRMLPQLWIRSRQAAKDLARAAERTGMSPTTVLVAAWCGLVAHRTAQRSCVSAILSSNRFLPQLTDYIGTVAQDALLALDTDTETFDDLLLRAKGSLLGAYRNSWFDAIELWDAIGEVEHRRGTRFTRDVVFNDLSALSLTARQWADPTAEPALEWEPAQAVPVRIMLWCHAFGETLDLSLRVDPQLLDRTEAEGFAVGLLALLRAAAEGPVPMRSLAAVTGVRAAVRGPDWSLVDGSWIHRPTVTGLLQEALGLPVRLRVEEHPDHGATLAADIAVGPADRPLTPAQAHRAVLAALVDRPTAMAPGHYTVHAVDAVDHPGTADGPDWSRTTVLAQGEGRDPEAGR